MADYFSGGKPNLFMDWYDMHFPKKKRGVAPGLEGVPSTFPEPPPSPSYLTKFVKPNALGPTSFPSQDPSLTAPAPATVAPEGAVASTFSEKLAKGLQDPAKMGLLSAGLSLLATPPRRTPYSGGELIGRAGLHGLEAFRGALKDRREQQRLDVATAERRADREERSLHYRAQEKNWEEQRRLEEERNRDRTEYYKDAAEIRRMTAESLASERAAREANERALEQPIPENIATRYGLAPGTTYRHFKELATTLRDERKKNRRIVGPDDAGNYTVWDMDTESVVATIDKAGRRTKVGSGTKPTNLQLQLSEARKQLEIDYKKSGRKEPPTPEEIAAKRRQMFPTGKGKETGKSIREQMLGGAPAGATKRVKMQDGSILYFDEKGNLIE